MGTHPIIRILYWVCVLLKIEMAHCFIYICEYCGNALGYCSRVFIVEFVSTCGWISNSAVVSCERYCGFVRACWINVHQSIFHTSYWFGSVFALRQISNNVLMFRLNSFCLMASTKGLLVHCAWISRYMLIVPPPVVLLPFVKVAYFSLVKSETACTVCPRLSLLQQDLLLYLRSFARLLLLTNPTFTNCSVE